MRRFTLLLVLSALGCRRHHAPPAGAELEPPPPAVAATENPQADNNAPPAAAPAATPSATPRSMPGEHPLPPRDDRPRMPDGGTLNGDPRGPRAVEVQRLLDAALIEVRACFDGNHDVKNGETPIAVHFFIEPPGYTGAVTLQADAPREVVDCARGVYERLRIPEFRGKKLELAPAFTYWKRPVDGGAKR